MVISSAALETSINRPRRAVTGHTVVAILAGIVLLGVVIMALFPSVFAPYDPLLADAGNALQPPSPEHLLGTDQLGRDVYSRVIYGARTSLLLGLGAVAVALVGGIVIGVLAGMSRGVVDRVLSRILDILFAFPDLLIAIVLVAILGVSLPTLLIAIGIGAIPGYARILRSQVQLVRSSGYVESATGLGVPGVLVAIRHIIPNSIGPLLVLATIGIGTAIIAGSALSFVGLGAQPPTPEWGLMLSESRNYLALAPWLGVWPGVFLAVTVVSINLVGRWLQRRFVSGVTR
ncbi:ABC transporter permease [Microbacterium sp. Root61]|uniref:ABC transporter permease n=1 Tax=Microbacterium sp. Root61 TaxID=1736570 RepID=UPI0009E8531F|nr:ABC transporter permease [Microbacterium sp. Root61]